MTDTKPNLADLRIDRDAKANGGGGRLPLLVAAAALVAIAVIVILLAGRGAPPVIETAVVRSLQASESTTVLNASGYVEPRRKATVAAKITGRVTDVLVEEGMAVEAGQVLARLDDSDARRRWQAATAQRDVAAAAIDEIEVNLSDALRTQRRITELFADGVASQQDLDSANATVDALTAQLTVARANLEAAKSEEAVAAQDLENYTIRAPFAGIAVSKDAQPGEMVSPVSAGGGFTRTGISTIVDMSSLEIEVDVNEAHIAKIYPGQPAEATLDAYPDWRIPATVRTIIPTADRQKATVKVRLSFDELDPRILPDMGVKVAFREPVEDSSAAEKAQAVVPGRAVLRTDAAAFVFVVVDGTVERRAISPGREIGNDVEVVAGLAPGELVAVTGLDELEDGSRVRIES